MMKNKILLQILLCFGFVFLKAQEVKTVTMEQAIQLGLEHSHSIKIDETKIAQADAALWQAKNMRLPEFKISGAAMALTTPKMNLQLNQQGGGENIKANSAYYGSANLSLPIFTGGKIVYGIKSAKYLLEATKLSAENNEMLIGYNISEAYNNLYKANQAIAVLKENLVTAQQRDVSFLNMENNGVLARNDRLKANLQTSNIELQLMDAQNNYQLANMNMNLMLGLPESTIIEVDPAYLLFDKNENTLSYYTQQAFENRKDLQAMNEQKNAAEISKKSAKANYYPNIALTGGYIAADVPNVLTIYNAVNVGVGLEYKISNLWNKNTDKMNADAQIKQMDAIEASLMEQIQLEVNREYQNYMLAENKIKVYDNAVTQANENYRITKNKFDNGLETITNLLDANALQIEANVSLLNAKADAALAYQKLLQTAGMLNVN